MDKIKENVWNYPRPAICESFTGVLLVIVNSIILAKTSRAVRVLETSHPPTYYIPKEDVKVNLLNINNNNSFCEWKGHASYYDLALENFNIPNIGWSYLKPNDNFHLIKGYFSFYASKAEKCMVNGELVRKQEGDFYGGWITKNLKGPFKGGKDTDGW